MTSKRPLLKVSGISKSYGGRNVLCDVSLEVLPSTVVCLTGTNGSGKTTLLDIICGFIRSDVGSIQLRETEISHYRPWQIARLGIARTFQETRPFSRLTIQENLLIASPMKNANSFFRIFFRPKIAADELRSARHRADKIGTELFKVNTNVRSADLSFGQRRLLEIARVVCSNASLILFDEPVSALSSESRKQVVQIIRTLVSDGASVLFVEHDQNVIQELADRVYKLHAGKIV